MASYRTTYIAPVSPEEARAKGISGTVILHAIISPWGAVAKVDAISGPLLLRDAAMDAVRQWGYQPYRLGGKPVAVDTTITLNFK